MIPIIVTMVVTMVVNGEDYQRHEAMASLDACWDRARVVMEQIRGSGHDGLTVTQVGVGCVVDAGNPA